MLDHIENSLYLMIMVYMVNWVTYIYNLDYSHAHGTQVKINVLPINMNYANYRLLKSV